MIDRYDVSERVVALHRALHFALAPKGDRGARRIFVIGHPRTGTTSLHRLFKRAGLSSQHTSGSWQVARYDCFSDQGQNRPVAALAATYPNADFVLNCRPVAHNLLSLSTHYDRAFSTANYIHEIRRRLRHFDRVLARLGATGDRLTIVNIERPGALQFVAAQLGLAVPEGAFDIASNKGRRPPDALARQRVAEALAAVGARGDEPLLIADLSAPASFAALERLKAAGRVLL